MLGNSHKTSSLNRVTLYEWRTVCYEVEITNAMFLTQIELIVMFVHGAINDVPHILCFDLGSWHIKSVYKINRQSVNPSLVQTSIHAANHSF